MIVQADETFIGGLAKNMHESKREGIRTGGADKMAVFGMMSGEGKERKVLAKAVDEATYKVIIPIIKLNLSKDATLITDSSIIYRWLRGYERMAINHDLGEFVVTNEHGKFHTNSIENLWSALKRMIKGTHIHVSQKHLQKYVDECVTRYLLRHEPEKMFDTILRRVAS